MQNIHVVDVYTYASFESLILSQLIIASIYLKFKWIFMGQIQQLLENCILVIVGVFFGGEGVKETPLYPICIINIGKKKIIIKRSRTDFILLRHVSKLRLASRVID